MPDVVIIAGPNGAGKSTFAPDLLTKYYPNIPFLNADTIAESMGSAPNVEMKAGRIMLARMQEHAKSNESFAFESTLAARTYLRFLKTLQGKDYSVQIAFLWLPAVDLSIQRVAERVRVGGHDIPIATIRRRFDRGRENFLNLYMSIADAWRLYNASAEVPALIASGDKIEGDIIINEELWQTINNSAKNL